MVELARFIDLGEDPEEGPVPPKTIDWEQDRTVIVSEINKAAGLELSSLPFLHWWTFMGYFGAIGEGQLSTVVDFGKEAVQIGSDVAEVQNVVDTAFGELRDQAEEFASTSITRFGMAALSAKKTASTYMAMARGMGVANQTRILSMQWQEFMGILGQSIITVLKPVVKWLNAVVSHMIALATLLNNTVTKAFGGESKQAEATSSAIASSVDNQEALTGAVKDTSKAQQKSLAGFDEITKLAGEAAESAGGIGGGGAVDVGSLAIPDLSELEEAEGPSFASWGEAFSAFLDLVLEGVPKLKTAFGVFADWLNGFSKKLYDMFTFPGVLEKVQQLGRDLADALNYLVAQIDWYQLGQALGAGLNLALQFLVSFLYSFDWIAWGGSLAALVNGAVSEIDWYAFGMLLFKGFKIALETLAGFLLGLDMPQLAQAASQTVIGYFNAMRDTVAGIDWAQIGAQIAEFLNNIDWAGAIAAFVGAAKELVLAFLEAVGGFISNADPEVLAAAAGLLAAAVVKRIVGTVVAPLAKELVDNVIKKIAEAMTSSGFASILGTVGQTIAGIGTIIGGVVMAAASFFSMWNEGFSWAKEAVMLLGIALTAVGAIILGAPALVTGVIASVVAAVATAAVLIHEHWEEIKQWFIDMWNGIQEVAGTIAEWFNSNVVEPIRQFFTELWQSIQQLASDAWAGIQGVWTAVPGWFNSTVIQPVAGFFKSMWDGIKQAASSIWEAVKGVWSAAAGWFSQHVTQPLASAFDAAGSAVKGTINGLISNVEGMLNAIIRGVNWLISQMNKISFDVPDWVPGIGGSSFGVSIPPISEAKLPRLARGAVIPPNREFLAVLGDQKSGTNIEAPLSTLVQAFKQAASEVGMAAGNRNMTVILQVDRRELGRVVYQLNNEETQRVGVRLAEART